MRTQQQNEKSDFWEQSLRDNALQHLVHTFTQYTKHIRNDGVVTLVLDKQTEIWMEILVNGYKNRTPLNEQLGVDRLHSFDFACIDPDFFSQFLELKKCEVVIMLLPPLRHMSGPFLLQCDRY
uniref:AlNc14C193G8498 protein n=1 Tax=Albugo laibachii Nc14 TaxID=890382 RepID=F0WQ16_9STRA|nr:AlNc14C193G8498 [Albugo laibachii Nc14]|eukprot:CCA23421.1 AlNc14C193G8498 [Albugo laibachii Nc14]